MLSIAAAPLVAGCGASQPPIGAPGAMPQSRAIATHVERGGSWMLPEAKSEDLLYVSTADYGILVYTYPAGKLVGMIGRGSPYGLCSDAAGDVFEADFSGNTGLVEYAHGGSQPIRIYYGISSLPFGASGCAVDPRSGNLAATVADGSQVLIWKRARGAPRAYGTPRTITLYCTYDGSGNLFVDQTNNGNGSYILELGKDATTYKLIKIDRHLGAEGGLLWDGKYVTLGDMQTDVVYRLRIKGAFGTAVRNVDLKGSKLVREYSIERAHLVGPDEVTNTIGIWNYPAGGTYVRSIGSTGGPIGSTISLASPGP